MTTSIGDLSEDLLLKIYDDNLRDRPSLLAAVKVNKRWYEALTKLLWRRAPKSALCPIQSLSLRQARAEHMTKIENITSSDRTDHQHLEFKSLKSVDIHITDTSNMASFRPYLQVGLEIVRFTSPVEFTPEIVDGLKKCTNINTLVFLQRLNTSDTRLLIDFFRGFEHLRSVYFEHPIHLVEQRNSTCLSAAICAAMLDQSTVQSLSIHHELGSDFEQLQKSMTNPTPINKVSYLSLRGAFYCISPVLSVVVRTLTTLNLRITTSGIGGTCALIGRLSQLRFLVLQLPPDTGLQHHDLEALGGLSTLYHLWITTSRDTMTSPLSLVWLSDEDFMQWLTRFECLQDLRLHWLCPLLGQESFVTIATHCSELRACEISWNLDLRAWQYLKDMAYTMLKLRYLTISEVDAFGGPGLDVEEVKTAAEEHINTLRSIAPNLLEFDASERSNESLVLRDAFSPLIGPLDYDSVYEM
ncbi:hypothetical protein AUEXF2481DRAFT_92784 [Aureobasidium subglaciale EXF-2481]|uniref:F-box domain-containing protein n=1 Tax=Aureobasidium subglaciale (strain EXF-2481) TaxID=1043005 RepID=A0A074XZ21_AURSE|nr:uncharacterized protein AUEXF2481DRAFT_92784 [Aureobasidium subglaciale EXF-2481]KAI5201531.1 hypothetical protein E4T38_06069 [Aureobasidium subglaciale]KAI5220108.1 hypothetical protein E4T40_06090 [Aureobasidium subglaciale]KAI5224039.1 hypothetical protein E4T41_05930 [Aureobasidium subglaciale]KAI5260634.1 hypothetical protein E4T46_05824 [Aureobasidium subglaciale]KEQ90680.1 hypothetical protein AUEXF2481DRAFT_92784 [Aureobasidium subglaciale EXF-2481]